MIDNPLLSEKHLPLFNQILPAHIAPAIEYVLDTNRKQIIALLNNIGDVPTWENFVEPLSRLDHNLSNVWSTVSYLSSVMDTPELRAAHDTMLPKLSEYYTELGQNEDLYQTFVTIEQDPHFKDLNIAQQKVIRDELRDFRLLGVHLKPAQKNLFKNLRTQLSDLESRFEHQVLDATQGFCVQVTESEKLKGIPADALHLAKLAAKKRNLKGWAFTLDYASYYAVQCYAEDRNLREELYKAYVTRASELGPNAGKWDNSAVMTEILALRQQLAELLGFKDFCGYSLATKMAKKSSKVTDFLWDLARRGTPKAKLELEELKSFALKHYSLSTVRPWDVLFLSEKLCQMKYHVSEEQLKAYFPIHKVLEGLFNIVQILFSMRIEECLDFEKWHESVRLFSVYDQDNILRGQFFLDLYTRENKREGAWVTDCRTRVKWQNGDFQIPVAYVTTNIAPLVHGHTLLRHDDVITIFHEFGHCLHHILTTVDYYDVSGHHGVEWDAIELPSQLMENWCWERESLDLITEHVETHEKLPEDLFQNLKASRHFLVGLHLVRQLEFAISDFEFHTLHPDKDSVSIQEIINKTRQEVGVVLIPDYNRFQNAFSHVFAGGYAAGYYSYLWAEVLSSDVYEKFKEEGILNARIGQHYLATILEQGASKDMMTLFVNFRGREPTVDALLRHLALI